MQELPHRPLRSRSPVRAPILLAGRALQARREMGESPNSEVFVPDFIARAGHRVRVLPEDIRAAEDEADRIRDSRRLGAAPRSFLMPGK